jgi:hypothetical protein
MSEVSDKLIVDKRMENKMVNENLYQQIAQWHSEVWGGTFADEQKQAQIVQGIRKDVGEEVYKATLDAFNESLKKQ